MGQMHDKLPRWTEFVPMQEADFQPDKVQAPPIRVYVMQNGKEAYTHDLAPLLDIPAIRIFQKGWGGEPLPPLPRPDPLADLLPPAAPPVIVQKRSQVGMTLWDLREAKRRLGAFLYSPADLTSDDLGLKQVGPESRPFQAGDSPAGTEIIPPDDLTGDDLGLVGIDPDSPCIPFDYGLGRPGGCVVGTPHERLALRLNGQPIELTQPRLDLEVGFPLRQMPLPYERRGLQWTAEALAPLPADPDFHPEPEVGFTLRIQRETTLTWEPIIPREDPPFTRLAINPVDGVQNMPSSY